VTRTIARRLVLLLPTLLGLSLVTFVLLRLIPGDPARVMLGEHATAEEIAHFRADAGLDRPLLIQYMHYAASLARGDWGRSIQTNLPVLSELAQRLPATIELSLGAMAIACALGIPAGVQAACRRSSPADLLATGGSLVGVSMPLFWLGLLLSYLFGYKLGWLPPSGRLTIGAPQGQPAADALRHLILPALTLSMVPLAVVIRMTRACLLDVLAQDYVRTARAKGLPERAVLFGHAMKNALPPILTVIGLQLGSLFSGAILTETVFSWPGMGQFIVDRVLARDYPAVQGVVLAVALLFVIVNMATDVCVAYLNPRIRYG
jgi:peptide/nickel transport system permease protein